MTKQRQKELRKPGAIPTTKEKQDEAIIGTNDYSIVSKRSVEKLYYPDEPEFLRPFVGKFRRRAPLINRGYWLRMRAIENVVTQFLDEKTAKSKVVVNLGCGYEPLPFRMLWKYSSRCRDVKFIDVDYPRLIHKKMEIIKKNSVFYDLLSTDETSPVTSSMSSIVLEDEHYCAVGCDLSDTKGLDKVFRTELQLDNHSLLFIGEVSIVYMEVQKADELIAWTGTFKDARFCLLEQHMPDGPAHPFARTMLEHFQKQTPLRCLLTYGTIEDQVRRFLKAGWSNIQTRDLWTLWQDQSIPLSVRITLDSVEPFDEWEELALFAGHYFLLTAATSPRPEELDKTKLSKLDKLSLRTYNLREVGIQCHDHPHGLGQRRFGAIIDVDNHTVAFHGGLISSTRKNTCDIFSSSSQPQIFLPLKQDISCHTITSFGPGCTLMVGGRNSPAKASPHCWLAVNSTWVRTHDLLPARFRHCSAPVRIGSASGVLTFGGRTSSGEVLDSWSLYEEKRGWQTLKCYSPRPPPLFGATMIETDKSSGILIGGMSQGGSLSPQYWEWKVLDDRSMQFTSRLPLLRQYGIDERAIIRFGASLVPSQWGVLLIGDIGHRGVVPMSEQILLLQSNGRIEKIGQLFSGGMPRPLLVGFGAVGLRDGNALIVGGSAVCFSFGAFWNDTSYLLCPKDEASSLPEWRVVDYSKSVVPIIVSDDSNGSRAPSNADCKELSTQRLEETQALKHATPISSVEVSTPDDFQRLLSSVQPATIKGLELGPCIDLWTTDYLTAKVGPNRPVVIHAAKTSRLSFHPTKNFTYETQPFGEFVSSADAGSHVYLRALSSSKPNKLPANLRDDFPGIAKDFNLPEALNYSKENEHSSVLRISGNISMWLHYDVMSNILCQIRGQKRVVLFPPSDVSHLNFPPGETTSNLSVFTFPDGSLNATHPCEAVLNAGEVMFIPACWPHTTTSFGHKGVSVAVNCFFRDLGGGYAAGRDVYGNRDLEVYQNGRRDVARILEISEGSSFHDERLDLEKLAEAIKDGKVINGRGGKEVERIVRSMDGLPDRVKSFYLNRLSDEIVGGIHSNT